ncbi:GDSL-type esterase/lipase family protein [uncultured Kocuria sp.]|uniref:GDSL-type esterase/lipase family protein n=1 Tax=uncultured Kocuria sp. TaxID=259305 RepID=UPI00262C95B1|nr:GDSL-type esterase/lipase family protein [uncultured Kocuria sp.]
MTPQSQWTDSPDRDIRVCFVGDSFVAGIGDSTGLGWVGRVTAAGLARGLRLTTYNLGVRRETSVQIGQRLVAETTPRLAAAEDPRIVISCGVNDTMHEQEIPRVPLSETVRALRNMHEVISPTRLLLIGPPAGQAPWSGVAILRVGVRL